MKNIYIIGAGGFAKEVYATIQQIGGYEICGFIDKAAGPDIIVAGKAIPIVAEETLHGMKDEFCLAMGVGDPSLISKLAARLEKHEFPNLIHPSVVGNFPDITMGRGNIVTANCVFTTSITIGDFNIFNLCCTVGHDAVIGNCNVINPTVNISGGVILGDNNLIGVNATILQYKKVGSNSIIGASSLVTKDVPDNVTVVGIPAVKIANR